MKTSHLYDSLFGDLDLKDCAIEAELIYNNLCDEDLKTHVCSLTVICKQLADKVATLLEERKSMLPSNAHNSNITNKHFSLKNWFKRILHKSGLNMMDRNSTTEYPNVNVNIDECNLFDSSQLQHINNQTNKTYDDLRGLSNNELKAVTAYLMARQSMNERYIKKLLLR